MPRFAVLEHDFPFLHWDLLLEAGDECQTWRLLAPPVPGTSVPAEPLPPHRLMYLTYEGSVSGNRGTVRAWDRGTYDRLPSESGWRIRWAGCRIAGWAECAGDGTAWNFVIP